MTKDKALALALEALRDLLDQTETPPDRNCSCHIAPPCHDCVDYGGVRYAIKQANEALTAIKEALAQPERPWVGLTDEELLDIADMAYANDLELLHNLQAKLKEKNT